MNKVRVPVQESNVSTEKLIGHQEIGLHIIFDIKLDENFRRKAIIVAVGHTTKTPGSFNYSSVFSIYLVRIMLIVASLNGLDLKALDIDNV